MTVPHDEISDSFNPFRMKEKYMKFFRVGSMKPIHSTDRMLKNSVDDSLVEFIND